jgi:hypothetical protein
VISHALVSALVNNGLSLRLAAWLAAGLAATLRLNGAVFGLDSGYPGTAPGSPTLHCGAEWVVISNTAISVTWSLSPQGFKTMTAHDWPSGRELSVTGEVFRISLADGSRYGASSLVSETAPQGSDRLAEPRASRLAARLPARQAEWPLRTADGRLGVVWRLVMPTGANYVRQELDITAVREDCVITELVWLDQPLAEAKTIGRVDGSPVVSGPFFLGAEDPMADNGPAGCRLRRNAPLRRGEKLTQSFVLGVAPAGQLRRAFLYYLERERAHPYRPFLHYNSWYDTAWTPFALNETNCLEAIRICGEKFIERHGVVMDAMVFDDGWDNPRTLWQFHAGFPNGFAPLAQLCQRYHTSLGVWLSPFGGYGEPRNQRLRNGAAQGYETNAAGFSLAGPKYYAAFKQACVRMIRQYGVNHFKFDGIATGMYARSGGAFLLDTEAMRRLMLELRQEDPNLYINLTTGSWPSPFWLRYADSVWRQGGDMGLAGKGSRQQQWLTYRDQETCRNIARQGPLFPLNSLMTQGVAYSRQGSAGDPSFNSAGFKDDVRAFFGSGTGLQELYIQPGKLTDDDWRVLAEAARWSRTNADVLVDAHWLGGDPGKLEVYGFASWTPRKGLVMLRNPDDQPHEFALEAGTALELPPGAARKYTASSPWAEDAQQPTLVIEAGTPAVMRLKPFEVRILELTPISP